MPEGEEQPETAPVVAQEASGGSGGGHRGLPAVPSASAVVPSALTPADVLSMARYLGIDLERSHEFPLLAGECRAAAGPGAGPGGGGGGRGRRAREGATRRTPPPPRAQWRGSAAW